MYDVRDETDNRLITVRARLEDAVNDAKRLSIQHHNHRISVRKRIDKQYHYLAMYLNGARQELAVADKVEGDDEAR